MLCPSSKEATSVPIRGEELSGSGWGALEAQERSQRSGLQLL